MQEHSYRLQLLAPVIPPAFSSPRAVYDPAGHATYLDSLQRLRARSYLEDGAVQPWQVDADGRHRSPIDERCWHFLLVNEREECIGCARYLLHRFDVSFDELRLRSSALAQSPDWGTRLRAAVTAELERARRENLCFAELGGWAIAAEYRHSKAALEILLGSYVWAELIGHCLCATTATRRHQSAPILRRVGGQPFAHGREELPGYFDPQYGCEMELLRFDSRQLPQRFSPLLREMRAKLSRENVLCLRPAAEPYAAVSFPAGELASAGL